MHHVPACILCQNEIDFGLLSDQYTMNIEGNRVRIIINFSAGDLVSKDSRLFICHLLSLCSNFFKVFQICPLQLMNCCVL